jgi:YD repeat-containing protein
MKFLRVLLAIFLLPLSAFAGVNLKNGNFYISYTDIIVPGGGNDLEITRTYNSRSIDKGWFGIGWGTPFETFITVAPDGSVTVHENGSGALTRFTPQAAVDAAGASKKIIEAMRKRTTITDQVASNLEQRLTNDADLRLAYSRRFGITADLAAGTVLHSNTRGIQTLTKTKDGFVREYNDGKKELFNEEGKLSKISDKNGYVIDLEWKDKVLVSIKDSQAKQLFFDWFSDGKIKHVWSAGDKKTEYKYTGENLTQSTDIAGNVFSYSYDTNHNMTKISYTDNTSMEIKYEPRTQFVSELTSRSGESTKYTYESNPQNPDMHYWTTVTKVVPGGTPVSNKYEYEMRRRPDGSEYTYRIATEVNGVVTDTTYSECCSLPLKIVRGSEITTFEYNDNGLLTKKSSNRGELVELKYHPEFNKITQVKNNQGMTDFEYDNRGNLSKANNSDGKSVLLIYDRQGRITRMVDLDKKTNERRTLNFRYNALGKPVEIAMDKVGKINVAYDNYGEILKVDSDAGHKMALQVTQAFQSLLAIVKPAGVNLNL